MSSDKPPAPIPTSLTLESQPNLLGIPLEIRHLIYDYVFKDVVIAESHSICDPQSHRGAYEFPNGSPYGLLWVNQQIRDEASSFAHVYPIHYIVPRCSSERRYPMLPLEVQQQISEIHAIATPNAVFRMRRLRSMINDPGLFGLTRVDCHHDTLRYDVSLTRFSEIAALIDQALDAIPFPQGRQGRFSRMRRLPTLQNTPHAYGHPSRSGYVSLRVPITFPAVIALRRSDLKTQDRDSGTLSHLRHEYLASVVSQRKTLRWY